MNWPSTIDILLAATGFIGAFYACYKSGPMSLWAPLIYFSLSGVLQAYSHTIANQCNLPANQVVTLLAYFHMCFQPFFINGAALHFIDKRMSSQIDLPVYTLCFISMTILLIQVYPFAWAGHCEPGSIMCGERLCTMRDHWLLGWMLPITQVQNTTPWYFIAAIVTPFVYGSWRFMLLYLLCCPIPAFLITGNMNEGPALSALFAIPFLLIVLNLDRVRTLIFIKPRRPLEAM